MIKAIVAAFLAVSVLAACSSAGTPSASAGGNADPEYLYGRHAGQPMRDAPDSY